MKIEQIAICTSGGGSFSALLCNMHNALWRRTLSYNCLRLSALTECGSRLRR